ncbi:MAG: hydroxysqualene dehydroxylase HpnE [Bacteroidetes bacterium]|nr:hydroxysqualene dehydroxylase HpnE [Bacteroidota bacterium]
MTHCIVVGGGVAGLAAALRLSSDERYRVTLFESAPALGGRVRSFVDRDSGTESDNGQHVLMGACTAALDYLGEIGTASSLARLRGMSLPFVHIDGRRSLLQAGALPHPLSLVVAFLRYDMLSFRARMRILRAAIRLRRLSGSGLDALDDLTAEAWLRNLGQGSAEMLAFWQPLVLATMNSTPSQASARLFAALLREIFLGARDAADMLLPDAALSGIFIEPAVSELQRRGVIVRSGTTVTALACPEEGSGRRVTAVIAGDERLATDAVILAMPPWALRRLRLIDASGKQTDRPLPDVLLPGIDLAAFIPSEILSVHVWLRRSAGTSPMTGLLGTTLQWVFFKGKTAEGQYHYSCTVSGAEGHETTHRDALRRLVLRELALLAPGLVDGDIIRILPIREKRATFVPAPGIERMRPQARTGVRGLYLAGDWTATGLPATIEGAVRSANSAVEAVGNHK